MKVKVMKVVTLPKSGATVTLRDPDTLRVKDRRKVMAAIKDDDSRMISAMSMTDGLIALLVVEWDLDLIVPSAKISSLDELEIADYDYLTEVAKDASKTLFPQTAKTEETEKDPESPTSASND